MLYEELPLMYALDWRLDWQRCYKSLDNIIIVHIIQPIFKIILDMFEGVSGCGGVCDCKHTFMYYQRRWYYVYDYLNRDHKQFKEF